LPTVCFSSSVSASCYTAPASVTITATAADADGSIAKVEYYNGTTLLGSSTAAPYSFTWANVAAGSYNITAKATDNQGASTTSTVAGITVAAAPVSAAALYYVHPDHLGSPRAITDQSGKTVWRWDQQEAFGLNAAQEDPDGDGKRVSFNLRFAGQYYDQESGLHYNRLRDYDPVAGRYIQADPIGFGGGVSLYGYVSGNPLSFVDPLGLAKCPDVERGSNGEPLRARTTIGPDDLGTGTGTNASSRAYAQSMGNASDDAGHILGRNLGGSGGKDNIFAQLPNINRGEFSQFEKQVAKSVQKNGAVDINVQFSYGNGGTRPTGVTYDVSRNGQKLLSRVFGN
jgi:RHS repeat-associated protein